MAMFTYDPDMPKKLAPPKRHGTAEIDCGVHGMAGTVPNCGVPGGHCILAVGA